MLIFWRGLGWLVPVVSLGAMIMSQLAIDAVYGDGFYTATAWPKDAAVVFTALSIVLLGLYLNHVKRRTLVDEETGEVLGKAPLHSFLFIPIEYWAAIILALSFLAKS